MPDRFCPGPEELQSLRAGPLGPHIESFARLIADQGYCLINGRQKIRLISDLSRWLERRAIPLQELDEHKVTAFFKMRHRHIRSRSGDQATMTLLLRHLRQRKLIPDSQPPPKSEIDLLMMDYEEFLEQERAFTPMSSAQYLTAVRRFLSYRFPSQKLRLENLQAKDVPDFVLHDSASRGRRSTQLAASALRSFLSFLFQRGRISMNLAGAVPTIAGWRLSELPRYLEVQQVEKVLHSCDRRTKVGKRNYAILLLLARLGLRAGEVANLILDDINWRAGELLIRGKGARMDRLPLLEDVGKALVSYLQKGRPECSTRRVFVQSKAPYVGFASPPNAVCGIVRSALKRAHVVSRHCGAHVLRHSLATRMLGKGASLTQIGQVLRHQLTQTTEIYAKVDLNALRALALPWPGGAQ